MKEFSKKTIALIYLAILLFSFFIPIQKTFAQTPKVPTITLTASPGTINSNGNTTITAKIDQSSIAKFAQKSNSVTFSSSPTVKGFDGTKCDTSERFTGQIWDCTVRFQSSTITKTTYTISASFVLGDKTYYAQPIKVEICGISEALDKGFCIEQGYGTVTLSTNPNPPTIAPGQQVQVTATVSATKGGQVISFFTNEDKKTCNIPTSTQAKNQSCSVVFTDTSFEERTFRVNANIYVDQNHFAKSDPIVDNNINGVDVTVKNPYTVMTVTPKTPTETKYTLLAPIGDFKEIETQKNDTNNPCPFGNYLNIMIRIIIGICAVLAMIMIVAGGIEYMTSELISSKEAGKERILHAILGLVIALGAYTILNTLNPQLLNACLNDLPKATITISPDDTSTGSSTKLCISNTNPPNPNNATGSTIVLNSTITNKYIKERDKISGLSTGRKLLITAQTAMEGFSETPSPGTKSYRTNNPGNIGNTDDGKTRTFPTLKDGIQAQVNRVVSGQGSYKIGSKPTCALGNETYNGYLYQYLRIYATGPRVNNNYLNVIIGFFKTNGKTITPKTTMTEIYNMQ